MRPNGLQIGKKRVPLGVIGIIYESRLNVTADAAAVYINASTRFTDGYEFGFGAEVRISTQKLQARASASLDVFRQYKEK